jgi:hypothetical protein
MMAHPLGITVTNLKYSRETLTLSTRIFYGDFWHEFQDIAKVKNKDYVKTGIDINDKKDFTNYFNRNIRLWVNNSEIHFKVININFERHEEDAYILLVDLIYDVKKLNGAKIKIKNTVLLNSIGGQKHLINVFLKDPNTPSHGIITLDKSSQEYEFVNN